MHSEMRRPALPDTPETLARIETALLREAADIRARQAARRRGARRFGSLKPALGLIPIALVVTVYAAPVWETTPTPPMTGPFEVTHSTTAGSYRDRLPQEDLALIEVDVSGGHGSGVPSNMIRHVPA